MVLLYARKPRGVKKSETLVLWIRFQHDNVTGVEELVLGLTDKGDINRYANILFHCVDTGRQQIAVYLIQQGMRTDIYKQVIFFPTLV